MSVIKQRFLLFTLVMVLTFSAAAQQQEWFGFTAYPGARELCSQSVLGGHAEILWHSYATKDKPSQVIDFYVKDNDKSSNKDTQGQVEQHGNTLTLRRGDTILSVRDAAGTDYPECNSKPSAGERTVILVSRMTPRGGQ